METTNPAIEQTIPPPLPINNSSSRRKQSKPNRLEHPTNSDLIDLNPPEHETDPSDRVSLNCEDGSLSSESTANEQLIIDENVKQNQDTILDFSFKTNFNHEQTHLNKKSRSLKRKHPNGNHSLTDEKVFHPDAFCNICQKEFCNKYFLKTHLANKHGIFDQESTNSSSSLSLFSGLINSEQDNNNHNHENDINNNNQISHLIEEDGDEQDGTGGLNHFENDHEQQSNPSTTTTKLFEDFCEICQKRFCNKYYLRKHKLDVHGVQTDCNIKSYKSKTTSSSPSSSLNVQQNLSLLLNPIFSTDQISQRRYTDSSNDSSILSKSSSYPTSDVYTNQISPCHLCGKKFQSNEYLQLHLMNKHQISNLIKKIKLETNETTNTSTSPPIPIVDTYFAAKMADRVSCDICHKQVCNKYFLKTHKFKVHGIGSDTNPVSSNDEDKALTPMNDQSPSNENLDEIESQSERIPTPNEITDGNSSIVCELCSKNFPSKFLLHIHMTNVHGIQSPSSSTATTIINDINPKILTNKKTITSMNTVKLKQTPQVQLRVTCQVCKKELCNKYFLRAHMRNVHNINLDEIDKQNSSLTDIQKCSNSNDNQDLNDDVTDSNPSENPLQSNEILSMQPFLVESDDQLYKDSFVPCMVYLPCRQHVTETIEISLRLKPIEKND